MAPTPKSGNCAIPAKAVSPSSPNAVAKLCTLKKAPIASTSSPATEVPTSNGRFILAIASPTMPPRKQPPPPKPQPERPLKTLDRVISKAGLGPRTEARHRYMPAASPSTARSSKPPTTGSTSIATASSSTANPCRCPEKLYLLLYKPTGYITTFKDPQGRPTVYDLIHDIEAFLAP